MASVPACIIEFEDGTQIRAPEMTGFLMKDGKSCATKDLVPAAEFANGWIVKNLVPDGTVDIFDGK